jgi:RimJ/RimL family protein N-acetyltransferase
MKYILETERLLLREFTTDDAAFILELVNSPGWLQYIGDRNIKSVEQAKAYLENGPIKSYRDNGFGLCLVERKDDAKAIGMCGILKREYLDTPDLGFAFLPEFYGKGYAYEIANATVAYAKNKLKISTVSAIVMAINEKSIRLLEKMGFNFKETIFLPVGKEELQLYVHTF